VLQKQKIKKLAQQALTLNFFFGLSRLGKSQSGSLIKCSLPEQDTQIPKESKRGPKLLHTSTI